MSSSLSVFNTHSSSFYELFFLVFVFGVFLQTNCTGSSSSSACRGKTWLWKAKGHLLHHQLGERSVFFLYELVGPVPLSTSTDSSAERSSETNRALLYNRLVKDLKSSEVGQGRILAEVGRVGGSICAAGGHLGTLQSAQDSLLPRAPEVFHVVVGATR